MEGYRFVDNAQYIVVPAVWPMVAISTVFFGLRVTSRIIRSGKTWYDDYFLAVGWMLLVAAASTLTSAVKMGHLTAHATDPLAVGLLVRVTHTCHLLSMAFTKTSFAVTLLRFTGRVEKIIIWFIIATINILFIFHVFAQWKGVCGDNTPYKLPGSCWDVRNPGIINITSSMYSAITDFVLAGLPWRAVLDLNMPKSEKYSVAIAMSFGIFAGATGVMKSIQSIKTLSPISPDFLWNLMLFWIFSLAEPSSTIIATAVPVLRVLFREAVRSYGSSNQPQNYGRSQNSRFQPASQKRESRVATADPLVDTDSDQSILIHGHTTNSITSAYNETPHSPIGISRKTEVSVEVSDRDVSHSGDGESYEMQSRRPHGNLTAVNFSRNGKF